MSISNKVQNFQRSAWYPVVGQLTIEEEGKVKIYPNPKDKDISFTVSESSINEDFIHPVKEKSCEGNSNPKFEMQIKKGAAVTLNYKNLTHTFTLDPDTERSFYLDTKEEKVIFLDETNSAQVTVEADANIAMLHPNPPSCYAAVIVAYEWCCNNDRDPGPLYGMVGCNAEWKIDKCCDPY